MNNVTPSLDLKAITSNGQLLWAWLGSFWQRVYQNPELAKNYTYGQGLLLAQLYLNFVESMARIDRNTVPVFHRERWKPVRILKSQAGTGQAALLRIGADPLPVIGPQVTSDYVQGEVFKIGGPAALAASVSYPADGVQDVLACISNSILGPKTVLVNGTDFVVKDSTIFFLREKDPFNAASFPTRKVSGTSGVDTELILWCMDTLEDRDFVYNQLGYIFNVRMATSQLYRDMMNKVWDLYNYGTPIQRFQTALGAILDEPTVINETETVDVVIDDGRVVQVVTDKSVYTIPEGSTLRRVVVPGAVLKAGDFLRETVRVYSNIDPLHLSAVGEYGSRIQTDIPAMFFGPNMLKSQLRFGVGASWTLSDIVSTGNDANGNPKLKFDLFGNEADVDLFWSDFWSYLEFRGISSTTCFKDYLDPESGATYGRVAPLEYFLRYFLRPNLCVIAVDADHLTDAGNANLKQLTLLQAALPAHALMLVTVQKHLTEDPYDFGGLNETVTDMPAVMAADMARPGGPSSLALTYRDRYPIVQWIPTCKGD